MMLITIFGLLFIATNTFSVPIDQQDNVKTEADPFRLPKTIIPSSYQVILALDKNVFLGQSDAISGTVVIAFKVTEDVSAIYFHMHPDYISITNVLLVNQANEALGVSLKSTNKTTQICKLELAQSFATGNEGRLTIIFKGKLSTTDMYGFYRSSYVTEDTSTKYLVTTQFQSTHTRRAFPCFDEPAFKATFNISIIYPSDPNLTPLGNTPGTMTNNGEFTTITFKTTPIMSTYLIAFTISEFTQTKSDGNVGGIPHSVWSQKGTEATRNLAVTDGPKLLEELNVFTNINYNNSMEKMDQIAIPDFAAGAMENWGLVTYRETALLWDENESSNSYKQRVATVIAHEFTHMWFGDLVTMNWWSETFLNEGFARYFQYFIAHKVHEDWQLDKQFVLEQVQAALQADALISSVALQSSCSTPSEISARFDTISYNKGATIYRMVEHVLGTKKFQTGLQSYLTTYTNKTVLPENLWTALGNAKINNADVDLKTIMENWVKKAGYPLVTAKLIGTQVQLTQERFLLSGVDTSKTTWYVPISYTTSAEKNFEVTSPKVWLLPDNVSVAIDIQNASNWILLNVQETGYYRVHYDENLMFNIKTALESENFDGISVLNRAQIVDDAFNLMKINKLQVAQLFEMITFLKNDVEYYAWYPAFSGFNYILQKVTEGSVVHTALSSFILELMDQLYKSVAETRDSEQVYTLKRELSYGWACKLGNMDCISTAAKEFQRYKQLSTKPNKNLRSTIYCYGLKHSEASKEDWEFLWNEYVKSKLATEQITLLSALGCTEDEELLKGYLNLTITDNSGIRPQDAMSVFQAVYTSSSKGLSISFDFLIDNYLSIQTKYASMNSLGNLITGIAGRFTTQEEVDKLTKFVETPDLPEQFKVVAEKSIETAKSNIKWIEDVKTQLDDYFEDESTNSPSSCKDSLTVNLSVLSTFLCVLTIFICNQL